VVVIADLVIVVSFSLTSAFAHAVFPAAAKGVGFEALVPHIFGSIFIGALLGLLLAIYVRLVGVRSGLFMFAMLFIIAEAGRPLHLNPLLVGLAAGLFLENLTPIGGEQIVKEARPVTLATFAIFFAVIGAEVQLRAFLHVAPFALAAAAARAVGIYGGTLIAARHGRLDPVLTRNVPFGLLPHAGVAIALAVLVLNDFQPWGQVLGTVLLGSIVVNQMIGPVLFRIALQRAGEIPSEEAEAATDVPVTA
jgi:Kef-type K+ transport system membrane component KefB